jgi:GNAT superfamily N-acetyltransferase
MDELVIEQAQRNDIPELVRMLDLLFRIERDFMPDAARQAAGLRLLLARPEAAVVFVGRDADRLCGMITAQLVVSTSEGAMSAWIEDVVVLETYRRRGLGRRLVDEAWGWARARGATRAQLVVDTRNESAMAFYATLGWESLQLAVRRFTVDRPGKKNGRR